MLKKLFLCLGLLSVATYAVEPQDFISAINRGDTGSVRDFLKTDPTLINAKDDRNLTVLELAVIAKNPELVQLLVGEGAEVTIGALMGATIYEKVEIVQCLVDKNSTIINDHLGGKLALMTPLSVAAYEGNLELVKLLVQKGANVNFKVLFDAIRSNNLNLDVVDCLLEQKPQLVGAAINSDALMGAIGGLNIDVMRCLLENDENLINAKDEPTWTPLSFAISDTGNLELVKLLIDKYKAKVNLTDLLWAIKSEKVEFVDYLVDQNPELLDAKNYKGQTLLEMVDETFNELVGKKFDNDKIIGCLKKYDNVTIDTLLDAIKNDKVRVAAYLLNKKPDIINDANNDGLVALSLAVKRGNLDIVKLLVNKGAKVNLEATDEKGKTLLEVADESGNQDVIDFLENVNQK